jgi:class 3 adenylate cyclase/pimeloyl-ACP methyl ester carboxylesterase
VQPKTEYTKSGDVNVAYQVFGAGQFDLVFVYGFVSHLDFQWTDPAFTSLLRRLASFSRVIVFDKRGTGLSDPVGAAPTFDERMDDVRAVMDAVGCEQAALVGYSEGGVIAALFAGTYPDRCRALVLYETWVSGLLDVNKNPGREKWLELDRKLRDAIEHWGEGRTLAMFAPSKAGSELTKRMWGTYERAALSPAMAGALWDAITNCDVRAVVPTVNVPTLVLAHRDSAIPIEHSRFLASHIDGARLVELPGQDHVPAGGDIKGVADEMEEFLTGARHPSSTDRVLATVMLTDIVGSTERGAALGDMAWKALRERHDAMVRQKLPRYGGRELKQTGDGFLAVFDGPARAVDCAEAVREAIRELGLELRIGIHTGECEVIGDDITGISVNIAARISALAAPSEILVSSTVRDLVVGSDLRFVDAGTHELKGVPGDWRVFRVVEAAASDGAPLVDSRQEAIGSDRIARSAARRAPGLLRGLARLQRRGKAP